MKVKLVSTDGFDEIEVPLEKITEEAYTEVSDLLFGTLRHRPTQAYKKAAAAMKRAVELCPEANPADLWVHLIYHQYRNRLKRNDQSWKRVSGDAFEHVIQLFYNPRLAPHNVSIRKGVPKDATTLGLVEYGLGRSKTDLIIEKKGRIIGVLHCKASIAERLTDDAPASVFLLKKGIWSGLATMDAKMFPPPHGDGVVRGELGVTTKDSDKRGYFEVAGQFSGCYSFNTRTNPSEGETPSGKRIHSLHFTEDQPDVLLRDILEAAEDS